MYSATARKLLVAAFAGAALLLSSSQDQADENLLGQMRGSIAWSARAEGNPLTDIWLNRYLARRASEQGSDAMSTASVRTAPGAAGKPAPSRPPLLDQTTTGTVADSFFGTVAIPFSNIAARGGWERVRKATIHSGDQTCQTRACASRLEALEKTVAADEGRSFFQTLQAVNQVVNTMIAYVPDQKSYRVLDYWATAGETVSRGEGDCEDFAILKHTLLRQAGIPAKSMSLVILKDEARGLYHAVLAVSTNKGHFILDNVRNAVYRDSSVSHYHPLYSLSADRSWIHGIPAGSRERIARSPVAPSSIAPGESAYDGTENAVLSDAVLAQLRPTNAF